MEKNIGFLMLSMSETQVFFFSPTKVAFSTGKRLSKKDIFVSEHLCFHQDSGEIIIILESNFTIFISILFWLFIM